MADQPIHRAAQDGDDDALGRELANGVSPNALGQHDQTPLHDLCLRGDNTKARVACALMLLKAGADMNPPNVSLSPPLHLAAYHSNADFVAALLEAGADVNRGDDNNITPLHLACMRRDSDVEPASVLIKNRGQRER